MVRCTDAASLHFKIFQTWIVEATKVGSGYLGVKILSHSSKKFGPSVEVVLYLMWLSRWEEIFVFVVWYLMANIFVVVYVVLYLWYFPNIHLYLWFIFSRYDEDLFLFVFVFLYLMWVSQWEEIFVVDICICG